MIVGKGKGKGGGGRKRPGRRLITGMAPDEPMPAKDGPAGPRAHYARKIEQGLHGVLFLLNYIAFVADGGFDVPDEHFAPRREDESEQDHADRIKAATLLAQAQAAAGNWAQLCADELRHIRPSDAGAVAEFMIAQGHKWCRESGFDHTANQLCRGALPLLEALCPASHLPRAREVVDMFWWEIVERRPPSIAETARRYPIATIHVAAAMTGWLFSQPECVPDRAQAQRELIELGQAFADPGGSRSTA